MEELTSYEQFQLKKYGDILPGSDKESDELENETYIEVFPKIDIPPFLS